MRVRTPGALGALGCRRSRGPGVSQPAINARGGRPPVMATIPRILIAHQGSVDHAYARLPERS